jgi:DNA-binding FadR family transcriptional regulator
MKEEIKKSQDDYADPLEIAVEHQVLLDAIAGGNSTEAAGACKEYINT